MRLSLDTSERTIEFISTPTTTIDATYEAECEPLAY